MDPSPAAASRARPHVVAEAPLLLLSGLPVRQPQPFRVVTGRPALGRPSSSPSLSLSRLRVPASASAGCPSCVWSWERRSRGAAGVPGRSRPPASRLCHAGRTWTRRPPLPVLARPRCPTLLWGLHAFKNTAASSPCRLPFLSLFRLNPSVRRTSLAAPRARALSCVPVRER